MNRLGAVLADAVGLLDELDRGCALVGGLAVSARANPRFTQDVDLAVAVAGDKEAEQVVRAFQSRGYSVFSVVEQQATGRLATARFIPPGETDEGMVLDLLFASSGVEPELVEHADPIEVFSAVVVRVARAGHLLVLKLLSESDDRPQDRLDLVALQKSATDDDLKLAANALALVHERGFNRERDLYAAFDAWLKERGSEAPG